MCDKSKAKVELAWQWNS